MAKTSTAPSKEILEAALQGLEAQRERLDEQINQVQAMMGRRAGRPAKSAAAETDTSSKTNGRRRKRRTLSAEARKRIAAAQKKRWAAFRKTQS